jgi:hypothetical protein
MLRKNWANMFEFLSEPGLKQAMKNLCKLEKFYNLICRCLPFPFQPFFSSTNPPSLPPHPNGIKFSTNKIVTLRLAKSRSRQLTDSLSRGSHNCRHFFYHVTFSNPCCRQCCGSASLWCGSGSGSFSKNQKTKNSEHFFCACTYWYYTDEVSTWM